MVRSEYAEAMNEKKQERKRQINNRNDLGGISEVGYGWLGRLGRRACEMDLWRFSDPGRGNEGP